MNIEEVRERWAKATPGPWGTWVGDRTEIYAGIIEQSKGFVRSKAFIGRTDDCDGAAQAKKNAKAIAAAPSDITFLLSEIDRLKAEVELREKALEEAKLMCRLKRTEEEGDGRLWFGRRPMRFYRELVYPSLAAWLREKESEGR